ncbi:MAG: hypothetical protein R2856_08835 [Caldilineaceae bacterium]
MPYLRDSGHPVCGKTVDAIPIVPDEGLYGVDDSGGVGIDSTLILGAGRDVFNAAELEVIPQSETVGSEQ